MELMLSQKEDIKDFIQIASELKNANQNVYECYKNRMIGALEVYKILSISGGKMNSVQVIDKREILDKEITTYGDLENPLFLAKDVANWIGHKKPNEMINNVDKDEKKKIKIKHSDNNARVLQNNTEYWFLTEDGLYEVLMQSRKPIAKQFKKEVKKMLKQIRLTGGYIPTNEEDDETTIMAKALIIAQKTINKKDELLKAKTRELETYIEKTKPKIKYVDEILLSDGAMLVTNIAADYGMSARTLNKILEEERIQRKSRGQWILYKDYMGKGYTTSETEIYGGKARPQTLWTQKGRMLIHEVLSRRGVRALLDLDKSQWA